ncbi:type I restriction-modification system subunit M N-terminal domain-containing protein [Roseovarius arcticus]|nr:type I restriction-modification system subunit M N-terminal domain-containing protein [Roseovarius arcticus]
MSLEQTLFAAADKMRRSLDAGEYKHFARDWVEEVA